MKLINTFHHDKWFNNLFSSSLSVKKPSEKTHDKRVSFGDKQNLRIEESQAVGT